MQIVVPNKRWFRLAQAKRLCSRHSVGVRFMKRTLFLVATVLTLAASFAADACTAIVSATLESSFGEAAGVVLAEVMTAARTTSSSEPGAIYPVETVAFKVLVTLKGSHRPGSTLEFKTAIGPASCGMSVDPDMRMLVAAPAKKLPAGGIWVLFLNSSTPPYNLEGPSGRIGSGVERNLGRLYELSSHRKQSEKS